MVDAHVSGACEAIHEGSSPSFDIFTLHLSAIKICYYFTSSLISLIIGINIFIKI